ncbi:MAG: S9 family peptidase, partial [Okeania sp. SIO2H7]|nr:S9 family peptidase [Okeania sp. SIO2H7]
MSENQKPLTYPIAPSSNTIDDYHGTKIADPYRELEDPQSEGTKKWIEEENEVTFSYLEEIETREQIKQRLTEIWDYEKYGVPFKKGDRYFYYKNDGLQNQNVLYSLTDLDGEPKVLIDPNNWSEDGTVALSGIAISKDGKLLAYGSSVGGSDWQEWRVFNIETREPHADILQWIKFYQPVFTPDNKGLFYSRYDAPKERELEEVNYLHKVYYHRLGTPQSEDELIYEKPDKKEWSYAVQVTDDGRYLIMSVWQSTERKNLVFYKDLTVANSPLVELISEFEAEYSFIDNDGNSFWFFT